ncbi:MAG TPA: thioredoxin family protein, partial [Bacteroidia bacterium]|nr:thioredoxin family protein [Bacteroidia bacterium]
NLHEAECYAKSQGKPLFIDFTGYACVNCRKMEDNIWPDSRVYQFLSEKYVVVSLYVDDKKELPAEQQVTDAQGRRVKTYGNVWSNIEADYYQQNSQPLYVLIDDDGKLLAPPRGYTPDAAKYADYLQKGLDVFEKRKAGTK